MSHRRIQRAAPVYALVLFKALVLTGNRRVNQVLRDILVVHPDTVFFPVQTVQFHIFTCRLVLHIQYAGIVHFEAV